MKRTFECPIADFGDIRYFNVIGIRAYIIQEKGGKYVIYCIE